MSVGAVAESADAAGGDTGSHSEFVRVLKQHHLQRIDAATLREQFKTTAVQLTPGAVEAAVTHVQLVVERLAMVNRQLQHVRRQLAVGMLATLLAEGKDALRRRGYTALRYLCGWCRSCGIRARACS